jgi:hypothetical protein
MMIKKLLVVAVLALGVLAGANAIHTDQGAHDIFPPEPDDVGQL